MDRPVKKDRLSGAEWESLLTRIQSHSTELEAGLAQSNNNLIEALSGLSDLETLTSSQLAAPLSEAAQATAASEPPTIIVAGTVAGTPATVPQSSAATQVQAHTQKSLVTYQTAHEEYAPALSHESLVEALLQYQRAKTLRAPKSSHSPQGPSKQQPGPAPEAKSAKADFSPMRIPSVQAEPKATPLGRAATPGVRLPVLRKKPDGTPNGFEN